MELSKLVKKCSKCKEEKLLSKFNKNRSNKDGLQGYCKICDRKKKAKYRLENKEKVRKYSNEYHAKECRFSSIKERNQFIIEHGSCCEICGMTRDFSKKFLKTDLCIDHCHVTNKNMGVLCRPCNLSAGNLDDNFERAYKLYEYLERTRKD